MFDKSKKNYEVGKYKVLYVSLDMLKSFRNTMYKYSITVENLIYFMEYEGKLQDSIMVGYAPHYDTGYNFSIYNEQFEYNYTDRPEIIRVSMLTFGEPMTIAIPNPGHTECGAEPSLLSTEFTYALKSYGPEARFCKLARVPYWLLERYGIYNHSDIYGLGQDLIHDELINGVQTINVEKNEEEDSYDFTMFHPQFNSPMKNLYIEDLNYDMVLERDYKNSYTKDSKFKSRLHKYQRETEIENSSNSRW